MQGYFTKQEAEATRTAVDEMFSGMSKHKQLSFVGHLNDIILFISAAKSNAPDETTKETEESSGT